MKYTLLFLCLLSVSAHAAGTFRDYQSEFDQYRQENEEGAAAYDQAFEAYKKATYEAFEQYKRQGERVWGSKNTEVPDNKRWVTYHRDMNHRSVIDFEKGVLKVEMALTPEQAKDPQLVAKGLRKLVEEAATMGGDDRAMSEIAKKPASKPRASRHPLLEDQLVAGDRRSDIQKKALEASSRYQTQTVTGGDGQKRVVVSAKLDLLPDHLQKRARLYHPLVKKYAQREGLPESLVLAVMETESAFNPMARSPAPAFGLMQLVPTSGARDAYRKVYKKDRLVSDDYLYEPDNNVELGSAYLGLLYYDYLREIRDPKSRLWMTIAAYNTGSGNVLRAFAGEYSPTRHQTRRAWTQMAVMKANQLQPEQVYDYLRRHLTYAETRQYVQKVRTSMERFGS